MKKFRIIAVALMAIALAVTSIGADAATKKSSKKKVVTCTTGKRAPTEGCAVTNAITVDLGLPSGTLWADRNVGAEAPHAYGGLYRYGNMGKVGGQGCPQQDITGTALDVATKKMGRKWVMPTIAQMEELWENTTHERTSLKGVEGYRLTGPNGNSIFLPLTGMMYSYGRSQAGQFGFYQTGQITDSNMYNVGFEVVTLTLWDQERDGAFISRMGSTSVGEGNPIRAVAK